MNADDLFTAPQVARICSTDLKTIHNWVNRGEIKSFRTPGRHLRFRRQDILDFLTRFGYPIPDGFSPTKSRVVLIEEKDPSLKSIKRLLAREFEIEAFSDQIDALLAIGEQKPSLVLVSGDAGKGNDMMQLVERLSSKKDACPIAVYSTDMSREKDARTAGAIEFIPSIDGKEIRKRVYSILGK
ncbi:MAG: helix-turn-helix domain-containing protein [Proteobacteria bacterium]|nr:helix-turn-helix domain-containing protein [Pseudomonadota bacterium]